MADSSPPPPQPGNIFKTMMIGLIIVVIAVIFLSAWVIWKPDFSAPTPTPSPAPTPTPVPTIPPEFSIQTTTGGGSADVYPGESVQTTVWVRLVSGDALPINLSVDPGTSGIQYNLSAGGSRPDFSAVLTMTVPYDTPPGWYSIIITGSNGAVTPHSCAFNIHVIGPGST
jgi:hypothetical protein